MDEKTLNSLMEDFTDLYETKPYLSLEKYYTYTSDIFGDCILLKFEWFNSSVSDVLREILSRYDKLYWCMVTSDDNLINISIFQECL